MKIAVISDIHSNITALEAVKKDIELQGVDQIHCLGDTLGYGPYPLECLNLVLQMCGTVLKGNHEDAVCNPTMEMELNKFASEGVRFSRSKLTPEIIEGIDKFPMVKLFPEIEFVICHGAFSRDPMWTYLDSPYKAKAELKETPHKICLVGHTHNPYVYSSGRGLHKFLPNDFKLNPEHKYIINVGSVGQPRDGDCRACYGIFNINDGVVTFNLRRVYYDISIVDKAIREAKISVELAERLYCGD